jgi:hypothetical protein
MPSAVDYAAGHAWVVHPIPGVDLLLVRMGSGLLVRDLVRRKGRLGPDRGTRVIVSLTLAGSIWIGILLRSWVPALDTPHRTPLPRRESS